MIGHLTPLDGRYSNRVSEVADYFSEYALIKYRVTVEVRYLIALLKELNIDSPDLNHIYENFTPDHARRVKEIEEITNHDVKAVEYFIREQISDQSLHSYIHFGLTSEDINNLAYSLMCRDFLKKVFHPLMRKVILTLAEQGEYYRDLVMLARTHGQPATPTTFGKEMINVAYRLYQLYRTIYNISIGGKLNGATGNFNAFYVAYPDINWIDFSKQFITDLGLKPELITTQINPDTDLLRIFSLIMQFNTVLIDLARDLWHYISIGYLVQMKKEGEVGSSTMPHKVNPIDFENSEGNLTIANGLFNTFLAKLPISRLQRDLSNSTIKRNYGVAFGHTVLALKSMLKGLNKITPDKEVILNDLNNHPEVLTEGYQTYLRKINYPDPYELFKGISRGEKITLQTLRDVIHSLNIDQEAKNDLLRLTPENNYGAAQMLAENTFYEIMEGLNEYR